MSARNSVKFFQGASALTTSTVGSAVKRAIGLNWSSVKLGVRPNNLSASGMMERLDRDISIV
jgi:hypothetical protein